MSAHDDLTWGELAARILALLTLIAAGVGTAYILGWSLGRPWCERL